MSDPLQVRPSMLQQSVKQCSVSQVIQRSAALNYASVNSGFVVNPKDAGLLYLTGVRAASTCWGLMHCVHMHVCSSTLPSTRAVWRCNNPVLALGADSAAHLADPTAKWPQCMAEMWLAGLQRQAALSGSYEG